MQQHRLPTFKRGGLRFAVVFCALFAAIESRSAFAQVDPVDDLRETLSQVDEITPAILKFREKTLLKQIKALDSIGRLRRGLGLDVWREDPTGNDIQRLDARMRALVAERLTKAIADVVEKGGKYSKHALANSIAETGPKIRAVKKAGETNTFGFARSLTPLVIKLAQDPDLGVRQEGLRALGTINPDPKAAIALFKTTIEADPRLGPRRVAAHGLMQMVLVASFLQSGAKKFRGVSLTADEALDISTGVSEAVKIGLHPLSDLEVTILCLQALQEAANGAESMIDNPFKRSLFPPEGQPLTPAERDLIMIRYNKVKSEAEFINQLLAKFKERKKDIAHAMNVSSSKESTKAAFARLTAVRTFERIANLRVRLKNRADSVILSGNLKAALKPLSEYIVDPFGSMVTDQLATFDRLLRSSDVRVRRSIMDLFGLLGERAAPALSLINRHLVRSNEPDRFVRWSAAEAVAVLPVKIVGPTVPNMVELLNDLDLDIRKSATDTLAVWGGKLDEANSSSVVQGLAKGAVTGDVEPRIASMQALTYYGPQYSAHALPNLLKALKHHDPRVRRVAALVIGDYGPAAKAAVPGLRHALGDTDQEVRINASDAILSILQPLN